MKHDDLSPRLLWTLILTGALTVGNIYISQPLLGHIAREFDRPPSLVGWVPALAQIGYVLSLLFVAPLGDVMQPRRLLLGLLGSAGAVLLLAGAAPGSPRSWLWRWESV